MFCRGRMVSSVQDLVIAEVVGRKLVFVLHSDGMFRVWDLLSLSKIFSCTMSATPLLGLYVDFCPATSLRFFVKPS